MNISSGLWTLPNGATIRLIVQNTTTSSGIGVHAGNIRPFMQFSRTSGNAFTFVFPDEATYSAILESSTSISLGNGNFMTKVITENCYVDVMKHPQLPLTDATTTISGTGCADGIHTITTSSSSGPLAFDYVNSTMWSTSTSYSYNGSLSAYTGATSTALAAGGSVLGDWIQMRYPYRFYPSYQLIQSRVNMSIRHPFTLSLLGSYNGADWVLVQNTSTDPANMTLEDSTLTFNLSMSASASSSAYAFFRLIVGAGRIMLSTGEWTCMLATSNSQHTPIRVNVLGNIECMSTTSTACLWYATSTLCQSAISSTAPATIKPYACVSANYTGSNWCLQGRNAIDSPRVYISDWSLFGRIGKIS